MGVATAEGRARLGLVGGTVVLAGVRAWSAVRAEALTSLPDEIGFLGDAWLVARGDPGPPMAFSPLYPGTYPLLLTPVAALTDDPAVLATSARVLNVVLLSALAPLLWAFLGRWERMAPWPRAITALAGSALPGLSVAALRAWPDALLAVGWAGALLALGALAGSGPLVRRVWFGPLVGLLVAAHSRFTPVAALAVLVLVLRLALPAEREVRPGRWEGRVVEVLNLVGLVVLAGLGRAIDAHVDDRWRVVLPDAASRLRAEPGRMLPNLGLLAPGQTWYLVVATAGTAAVGVVVAVRMAAAARGRGRALWCEPGPLVGAVAVGALVAVVVATGVQLGGSEPTGTTTFDWVANGRYQEVLLPPLVVLGLGWLVRRGPRAIGVEVGVAAVAIAAGLVVHSRLGDPPDIVDPGYVPVWRATPALDLPVVVPTAAALSLLAVIVALRRLPDDGRALRRALVPVLVPGLVLASSVAIGANRAERVVTASRSRAEVDPDVTEVRRVLDGRPVAMPYGPGIKFAVIVVGWALAEEGVVAYDPGDPPPERFVLAPATPDGRPATGGLDGAVRRAVIEPAYDVPVPLVLWERPGG